MLKTTASEDTVSGQLHDLLVWPWEAMEHLYDLSPSKKEIALIT